MYEMEEAVKKKSVNARKVSRGKGKSTLSAGLEGKSLPWSTTQCKGLDFRMI